MTTCVYSYAQVKRLVEVVDDKVLDGVDQFDGQSSQFRSVVGEDDGKTAGHDVRIADRLHLIDMVAVDGFVENTSHIKHQKETLNWNIHII